MLIILGSNRPIRDASGALPVLSKVDAATGLHHLSVGYNAETDSYSPFFFQHPTVDTGLAASLGELVKVSQEKSRPISELHLTKYFQGR